MLKDTQPDLARLERDVNFIEYAASRGYNLVAKELTPSIAVMRHPSTDDRIIIARSTAGPWVYGNLAGDPGVRLVLRDKREQGTLSDFVERRTAAPGARPLSPNEVWAELAQFARRPSQKRVDLTPIDPGRFAVARTLAAASTLPDSPYFQQCGLRPETLRWPNFAGTWKQDVLGNVLFPANDRLGAADYYVANLGVALYAGSGPQGLWSSASTSVPHRTVVFAETPVAAMSYHQVKARPQTHPDVRQIDPQTTRYVSSGASMSPAQLELVQQAFSELPVNSRVIAAFGGPSRHHLQHQLVGEIVAAKRPDLTFQRDPPILGADWTVTLRRIEADYVRAIGGRPSHERGR
jgi:hypothetical protein